LTRVAVVGGGFGGLASAIILAKNGIQVDLVDPNSEPGGKVCQKKILDCSIDCGPTVITLKKVFENLFSIAGEDLDDWVVMTKLNKIARHVWSENEILDLFSEVEESYDAIGKFAGKKEADNFKSFCLLTEKLFQTFDASFMKKQNPGILSVTESIGLSGAKLMWQIGPFSSLWKSLNGHFSDPRLRQLFGRYATYCGSSPWLAPSTLMLIWSVEMQGVWSVKGGIIELARALTKLAKKVGVVFHQDFCEEILTYKGRVSGVRLSSGQHILGDKIIFNGDYKSLDNLFNNLQLKKNFLQNRTRSLSAVTWGLRTKTSGLHLERHNVFFAKDYVDEFSDIFKRNQLPKTPTVYICAQDRTNNVKNLGKQERLFILVNAPPDGDQKYNSETEIKKCQSSVLAMLQRYGLKIEKEGRDWKQTTPEDFHKRFPGTGGALYGMATHGWMSPFLRPSARSKIPGLYLSGGSIHPGPGLPMVTISGQLAAEALMEDLGLIK
tara:strand:+ start:8998 stop:10479 length:1482 start_codon:yes stop_codon:yes gene_type:complete